MSNHPYGHLPEWAFWRHSVAGVSCIDVDPCVDFPFTISQEDKIASAGSCFAQHISRYLKESGFNFYQTESLPEVVRPSLAQRYSYGTYSARYGNIYTAKQLLQLFQRAFGTYAPLEDCWANPDGSLIDPFRPQIQPAGFSSECEFRLDARQHLQAVRDMFTGLDVFVFTLGLTERWQSSEDGAVYPVCPGVVGGVFDQGKHEFCNPGVSENLADLTSFLHALREVNPDSRVILTVSPVPLVASASGNHVLAATTYSKSVLRVVCEEVARLFEDVVYFPSYEIITGPHSRGVYFDETLRKVKEEGVRHVMSVFFRHFSPDANDLAWPFSGDESAAGPVEAGQFDNDMKRLVDVDCDEETLDL